MTPEDKRILFRVAHRVCSGNRKVVKTIRQLAETEENYQVIIREIDRVQLAGCPTVGQCSRIACPLVTNVAIASTEKVNTRINAYKRILPTEIHG